ncbi:DUF2779 domain-containing protein [Chitinilyticum aquatile]|uniref:DUF2779 domain-containing protein n=1 Tax=Chitinilyticum aquatile TaxID=362520 RepID=UPI00041E331F|nr:DUF2779 domain-containing protein [Chitinilyticum aquatile]
MPSLSKSKIMAYRQCPKRVWIEVHHPELQNESDKSQASLACGYLVGGLARQHYDPQTKGVHIDHIADGFSEKLVQTSNSLTSEQPLFEAALEAENVMIFSDLLLPAQQGNAGGWDMFELKSTTHVKDYHRDEIAIQAYIARQAGLPLNKTVVAHLDKEWIYPGNGDYHGLLVEHDLTDETIARAGEVASWIKAAKETVSQENEPQMKTGSQCETPYKCGFSDYCFRNQQKAIHPIHWLPRPSPSLSSYLEQHGITELRDVPDDLLNKQQKRVKYATLSGTVFFDQQATARALSGFQLPAYFLDFETISFAVPIWAGTRPYQKTPFQFSVHRMLGAGHIEHSEFLDISGNDPAEKLVRSLLAACGKEGPIFVYYQAFEKGRINELAERFPEFSEPLLALNERIVDLLPIAREHYYHPNQHGSWSIKAVLPALCPELSYDDLHGVQDGSMAMDAYLEAIASETSPEQKQQIEQQLLTYCKLDTYAMVRLWSEFSNSKLNLSNKN